MLASIKCWRLTRKQLKIFRVAETPLRCRAHISLIPAMLHNSTSTSGIRSRAGTPVPQDQVFTGLRQDYCICIICDCVPRNFCRTYESENSVCPPSPGSCRPSSIPRLFSGRASSLLLFKELYQSHFAPGSCFSSRWQLLATLRANSRRYRLPLSLPFLGSILSRPPSFYLLDVPSREKRIHRQAVVHPGFSSSS